MTKIIKSKRDLFLFVVIVVLFLGALGLIFKDKINSAYWYYNNNGETAINPGQGPTEADIEFMKKCSLLDLFFEARNDNYKLHDYKCSEEEEFKGKIAEGQEAIVDIYTKDFNAGKQLFRDWLKSKGLAESPALRITYIHKPQ